ncbi:MAG: hypothetical protein ACTSUO_06480 [Candidatus Thorarchaeota archaeon]
MPKSFIRETIEIDAIHLVDGFAAVTKKINLKSGFRHNMMQVDLFQDSIPFYSPAEPSQVLLMELGVSPYPILPTNMQVKGSAPNYQTRMPSAGSDTMLFKALATIRENDFTEFHQFPSAQIAAEPSYAWYSNEIYVTLYLHGENDQLITDIALSFYLALDNKKADSLEAGLGILREKHEAHCMELMSNGHMTSKANLRGNVFPMWRYGGIRPEYMLSGVGTGGFFLPISTKDEELMVDTPAIRSEVAKSRQMAGYDQAFGTATGEVPDWLRFNLVQGLVSGSIRDQWPPNKYHDNGNVMML